MATKVEADPKQITFYGRLSFPTWTAHEAYEKSLKSNFPAKDAASAKPNFMLVVEQPQLDKVLNHIKDKFFPHIAELGKNGDKGGLDPKDVAALLKQLEADDFDGPLNLPVKAVSDKTLALAPEAVAQIKLLGNAGVDIDIKAMVNGPDELDPADTDVISFPTIKPIGLTVHDVYPGALVAVTGNLYAYLNGKNPGFSIGASTAVFKADADRFGGGVAVDESEIFAD